MDSSPLPAGACRRVVIGRLLAVAVPLGVWFAPLPLEPLAQRAFAIASFMLLCWMTQALDHALAGLIGCYLFWALGVASFHTAFAGFSHTTPWFLFGAILFGMMATKSGLARRLAFLVPSGIARVVIMATIALGLMEAFGVGPGTNIGRGLFVILTYTATIFDKMIIAGAASITAQGFIERVGEVEVLWSRWAIAYLPCDLITILAAWRLTLWFYPPERATLPGGSAFLIEERRKMGAWSALEKRAALLMLAAIALWLTDFLHHIPAPMIGLGVGLAAALPRIGVLDTEDVRRLNYLLVFFVASAISMGEVLMATKALDVLTGAITAWLQPLVTNVYSSTLALYWTGFLYHIFIGDEVSMLSTSIPVLMNFARSHSLDPLSIGMVWTFAAGGKIFVYQSAVLVVGYSYGQFDGRDLFRMGLCLTIVESIILLLLVPFYWPLIGIG